MPTLEAQVLLKLDSFDKRFDSFDEKLSKTNQEVTRTNEEVSRLNSQVTQMSEKLSRLGRTVDAIEAFPQPYGRPKTFLGATEYHSVSGAIRKNVGS